MSEDKYLRDSTGKVWICPENFKIFMDHDHRSKQIERIDKTIQDLQQIKQDLYLAMRIDFRNIDGEEA